MSAVYQSSLKPDSALARRGFRVWLAWFGGVFIWLAAVFAAPLLENNGNLAFADAVYGFFSWLCHQMRERSFLIKGEPLAVCARCLGIYAGIFVGSLVYPMFYEWKNEVAPRRSWLFIAPIPMVFDFGLTFFDIWENTHFSRFTTALPFGFIVPFYVVPALLDLLGFVSPLKNRKI